MNTNTWSGNPADLAAAYAHHSTTLRGALRHALVTRALPANLPGRPSNVLDIGGGTGEQVVALARADVNARWCQDRRGLGSLVVRPPTRGAATTRCRRHAVYRHRGGQPIRLPSFVLWLGAWLHSQPLMAKCSCSGAQVVGSAGR